MLTTPVEIFRRLTNGVYVVGVAHGGRVNAFTAAWLTQVAFEPLLVALSVNPSNASWPMLLESRAFAVSVLREDQQDLARHFGTQSAREVDKLAGVQWRHGASGAPVLESAAAHLDCLLTNTIEAGDHVLVVGRVVGGAVADEAATPLRYSETGNLDGSAALYPTKF